MLSLQRCLRLNVKRKIVPGGAVGRIVAAHHPSTRDRRELRDQRELLERERSRWRRYGPSKCAHPSLLLVTAANIHSVPPITLPPLLFVDAVAAAKKARFRK